MMRKLTMVVVLLAILPLIACAQFPRRFDYIYLKDSLSMSDDARYRLRESVRDTGWGASDLNEYLFNLIWAGGGSGGSAGQNNVLVSKNGAGVSLVVAKTDTTLWIKRLKGSANITVTDMGDSVILGLTSPVVSAVYVVGYTGATEDTIYVYTKGGWRSITGTGGSSTSADSSARAHTAVGMRSETATDTDTIYVRTKRGTWRNIDSTHRAGIADSLKNKRAVGYGVTASEIPAGVSTDSLGVPTVRRVGSALGSLYLSGGTALGYPLLGMNMYWDSGLKFGVGSSSSYGNVLYSEPGSGKITLAVSAAAGNADATTTLTNMVYFTRDGNGYFTGSLVKAGSDTLATKAYARLYGGVSAAGDTLGWFTVDRWGADPSGTDDATAAIQACLTLAQTAGGVVYFPPGGTYKVASSLTYSSAYPLKIIGTGATISGTTSTDDALLSLGGSVTSAANLKANAYVGGVTVTTTAALAGALAADDVVMITSAVQWDSGSVNFTRGEMAVVQSVTDSTVTLKTPLYDSYTTADTLVLLSAPVVEIDGLTVIRNSDDIGIQVRYAMDISVRNCKISGARKGCYYLYNVIGGEFTNNYATDFYMAGFGYGLAIMSSQDLTVSNNRMLGGRHAMASGGDFPVRDVLFIGNTLDNLHGQSPQLQCFDLHPNTEFIKVIGNTFRNGVILSGINVYLEGNTITGVDAVPVSITVEHSKHPSYRKFANNEIRSFDIASSYPAVMIQALTRNGYADEISFTGDRIRSAYYGFRFLGNSYDTHVGKLTLTNVAVDDSLGGFMDVNSPAAQVDTVIMRGCSFNSYSIIMDATTERGKLFVADNCTFTLRLNGEYGLKLGYCADTRITNSTFRATHASGGWQNNFTCTGDLTLVNVKFDNWENNGGLYVDGPATSHMERVTSVNGSGAPDVNTTKVTGGNVPSGAVPTAPAFGFVTWCIEGAGTDPDTLRSIDSRGTIKQLAP